MDAENGQDDADFSEPALIEKAAYISRLHLRHMGTGQQAIDEMTAEWIAQGFTEEQANRSTMFLMNVNARRKELCGGEYPTQDLLMYGGAIICLLVEKLDDAGLLTK